MLFRSGGVQLYSGPMPTTWGGLLQFDASQLAGGISIVIHTAGGLTVSEGPYSDVVVGS